MVGYMFRTEKAHLPVHYNNYGSGYRLMMPTLCYVLHYIYIIYTRELKCQPCNHSATKKRLGLVQNGHIIEN
jgi:hypothetical protein